MLDTDEHDWRTVWTIFRSIAPNPTLMVDGDARPMPGDVQDAWRLAHDHHVMLTIPVNGLSIHFHFLDQQEMEMDMDPKEVTGPDALQALAGFMEMLGAVTGKTVMLTHENARNRQIARVSPAAPAVRWAGNQ